MPTVYRPIREEEWQGYVELDAYAFAYEPTSTAAHRLRVLRDLDGSLAAVDDGRIVAQLHVAGIPLWINGTPILTGMVADVSTAPEHRRKGHVGGLLREALTRMRDRGQALSALTTNFYPLYERYGWTLAGWQRHIRGVPADLSFRGPPPPGTVERINPADHPRYTPLYEAALPETNCGVGRPASWWAHGIAAPRGSGSLHCARWLDTDGSARGYVLYELTRSDPGTFQHEFQMRELLALTADAYRGLLNFVALHDLAKQFHWPAPEDDPIASLLLDPNRITSTLEPGFMLRVVDLPAALVARACLDPGPLRFTLQVQDRAAPWNDGVWQIERDSGVTRVTTTVASPDIALNITTLAALYNGFLSPTRALAAGMLASHTPHALAAADRFVAVTRRPFIADAF